MASPPEPNWEHLPTSSLKSCQLHNPKFMHNLLFELNTDMIVLSLTRWLLHTFLYRWYQSLVKDPSQISRAEVSLVFTISLVSHANTAGLN